MTCNLSITNHFNFKHNFIAMLCVLFITGKGFGQTSKAPRNLKQAVAFLNKDCTDSLKAVIINTPNNNLKNLSYPWGGDFKTLFEWKSEDDGNSKIVNYLAKKGIKVYFETVILIAFKQFLMGQQVNENVIYRSYQQIEKKWAVEDLVRLTADSLRGVYIPKDLDDCLKQIDSFWNDSTKNKVRQMTEESFSVNYHLGFGTWLRNNWGLWAGSRLNKYF